MPIDSPEVIKPLVRQNRPKISVDDKLKAEMPRTPSLFWDCNPMDVDPEANARYIVERILDFGDADEVRWMWRAYPKWYIKYVLDLPRCVVNRKSRKFWELMVA